MKQDFDAALSAVWDNINMARFFLEKARTARKGEHDIRFRWCLNIAAGALWSAVDIFIDWVKQVKRSVKVEGAASSTTAWFEQNEELVNRIRNGAVHDNPHHGLGQTFSPRRRDGEGTEVFRPFSPGMDDEETTSFLWIGGGSRQKQIPTDEVLSRLETARKLVEDMVLKQTGVEFINFG